MKTVEELLKDPSVVFLVDGEEAHQTTVVYFNPDTKNSDFCGLCLKDGFLHRIDRQGVLIDSADLCKLIPRPVKHKGWVLIGDRGRHNYHYQASHIYATREQALASGREDTSGATACIEVEFQEGDGL
jgi:hypothetical protein